MSILNLRPAPSDLSEIPFILEQLNIMDTRNNNNNNNNNNGELDVTLEGTGMEQFEDDDEQNSFASRRSGDRALAPRISSLENSLVEHIHSSVPSLDEIVIRQRGRKKQPAKISWSPMKSPFKTPTKKSSSFHMSLLSPSPAKQLFNNSANAMTLRSSPRKRIFMDASSGELDLASSSTPLSTPTKRLKLFDDRPMNAANHDVPVRTLLKGLTQEQLTTIICDLSAKDLLFEENVRKNIPLPDVRAFEEQLCSLRKNVTRSSPRSRLLSKTDGAAHSRASDHLTAFRKTLMHHCKILNDSHHYDALIDYILIAWSYVANLPLWDETSHNILRKECFKILTLHARSALKCGGVKLGPDRINNFRNKLRAMKSDYEEIGKCQEALNTLARN